LDLNQAFFTEGVHRIYLQLTPLAVSSEGRWAFRARIVAEQAAQKTLVLREFDADSDKFSGHSVGQPIPDYVALISVAAGGQ